MPSRKEPYTVHGSEVEPKILEGEIAVRDMLTEDIYLGDADFPEGTGIGTHVHPTCHEVIIITQGASEFHWGKPDGEVASKPAPKGTYVFVPQGVPHGFKAVDGAMSMTFIYLGPKEKFARDFVEFRDGAWVAVRSVDF